MQDPPIAHVIEELDDDHRVRVAPNRVAEDDGRGRRRALCAECRQPVHAFWRDNDVLEVER